MGEHLANAPLVEIIAELRWSPKLEGAVTAGPNLPSIFPTNPVGLDEFITQFAAGVPSAYSDNERLVPPNFPLMMHQPVYRLRQRAQAKTASMFQVGAGFFSANATPPYESWEDFRNVVRDGVTSLLSARSRQEHDLPFAITLRYIDAFNQRHTEGRTLAKFINEVLGITLTLPVGLTQHLMPDSEPKPTLQCQIPMSKGMVMSFSVGEGIVNGQSVILTDTSVSTALDVPSNIDAVMETLEFAHQSVSASFKAMTKPIHHLMAGKGE
ncbi:TIGR04255 family protein [Massilia sp.]|uniref:TIGR04255 family protein n=1 Tax=Massilia sp. TaxID=1882437 RepID=UPI00352C75C7